MNSTSIVSHGHMNGARPSRHGVTHSFAALAFVIDGRARLEQRGLWNVEPGDVMLVPAGERHRFVDDQRPSVWGLRLEPAVVAHDPIVLDPFERVRYGAAAVIRVPSERHSFLETLFRELQPSPPPEIAQSLVRLIVHEVDRSAPRETFPRRVSSQWRWRTSSATAFVR